MKRKRLSDKQIARVLRESEAGVKTTDLCRKYGKYLKPGGWITTIARRTAPLGI